MADPVVYTPRPYVRDAYTPDTRSIGALLLRRGQDQGTAAAIRGATAAQMWQQLARGFQEYGNVTREQAAQAATFTMREAERQAAEKLKRDEMAERKAEREADQRRQQQQDDRQTAIYTAGETAPGPIDRFTAEILSKFPGTAARVRGQQTLPATVTPGAFGEVSQEPEVFPVLEPSAPQIAAAQAVSRAEAAAKAAAADRAADNARLDAAQREAMRHNRAIENKPATVPAPSFQSKEVLGDDGKPVMANFDARSGHYINVQTGKPIANPRPVPSATEMMDSRKFSKAAPVLKGIGELSERINTLQGVVAKASGEVERQKARVNLNDDVAEYEALVSGFTPMIARALGHTGVLTQQDVDSVKALFPRPGDSRTLRDRKVTRMMGIIGELEGVEGLPPKEPVGFSVTAPDGQVFTFPTQAAADVFKKRAGIK